MADPEVTNNVSRGHPDSTDLKEPTTNDAVRTASLVRDTQEPRITSSTSMETELHLPHADIWQKDQLPYEDNNSSEVAPQRSQQLPPAKEHASARSQQLSYGLPPGHNDSMIPPTNHPLAEHPRPVRPWAKKAEKPIATTPPPPPPTPPYELRNKPRERVGINAPRLQKISEVQAEEFLWTRKIDFAAEQTHANNEDSVYQALIQDSARMRGKVDETMAISRHVRQQNAELMAEHAGCAHKRTGAFIWGMVVGMAVFMAIDRWRGWPIK